MSGTLCYDVNSECVWAINPWLGPKLCCLDVRHGQVIRSVALWKEPEGVAFGGMHIGQQDVAILDTRSQTIEVFDLTGSSQMSVAYPKTTCRLTAELRSPYVIATINPQEFCVLDQSGDTMVHMRYDGQECRVVDRRTDLGRIGEQKCLLFLDDRVAAVSRIYAECNMLRIGHDNTWHVAETPNMKIPSLLANSQEGLVMLGQAENERWILQDNGHVWGVEGIDVDHDATGLVATETGYLILVESKDCTCVAKVLRPEGNRLVVAACIPIE